MERFATKVVQKKKKGQKRKKDLTGPTLLEMFGNPTRSCEQKTSIEQLL